RPALRVLLRADYGCDRRLARALQRLYQHARRIGMGAVTQHHVEEQHADTGIGERARDMLVPEFRLDHRMRPAAGVAIVAEINALTRRLRRPQYPLSLRR